MGQVKITDVECQNGHVLFGRYKKEKSGFLMKCYIDEIGKDFVGVKCKLRVGRVGQIHGRPCVIINHGAVKRIKTWLK